MPAPSPMPTPLPYTTLFRSGGHAFVLFTSLRAMERGFDRLQSRLRAEGLDWPLLLQGSGSKNELLERFRRSPNAILVGRSEEHTSELQSHSDLVCRLLLEKK